MNKHNDHILHVSVCAEGSNICSIRTYRLTDMKKLIVAFRNIGNAHKNDISYRPVGYVKLIQYKCHRIPRVNYVARTVFVFLQSMCFPTNALSDIIYITQKTAKCFGTQVQSSGSL
jgi:hypothetical protein